MAASYVNKEPCYVSEYNIIKFISFTRLLDIVSIWIWIQLICL